MATVHRVVQKLHAELHFGRALLVILINESRIAAKLAKTGELGQHLHSDIGKLFVLQHEFQALDVGVIELLLLPLKGDHDAFLDLIRQVGKDFFFQAA